MTDQTTPHPKGAGSIRRMVIRKIASEKRCSMAVAFHVYACKPIKVKERLCREIEATLSKEPS